MANNYLGGMSGRIAAQQLLERLAASDDVCDPVWRFARDDAELFLGYSGTQFPVFTTGPITVLIRGQVVSGDSSGPPDPEHVADDVRRHYLETGELPLDRLEGSFTLILLDGRAGRLLLYRNLVGNGFTYYREVGNGLVFGSNLADLVDAADCPVRPNREALPAFFLYRFVPGSETLFEGFYRLMPGELVTFDAQGLRRSQRQTLADLQGPHPVRQEALECLEETLGRVVGGWAAACPRAANLLSGGVDSSYLQALWNQARPAGEGPAPSFSVSVDHPRTRPDTEYALSAARALGTRHTLVPADAPYVTYLLDALSSTAEPPNHVQSAYFGHLARELTARGVTDGLCGEGADSLFGLGSAEVLHTARVLRTWVPLRSLRHWGTALAARAGREELRQAFGLADRLDNFNDLDHPVNRVAVFTDWPSALACFGAPAVAAAAAYRRALLDRYGVPAGALERVHACGFLGEAMDSASLWTTLFNRAGADLFCPFLDSRLLRLAVNIEPRYRFPFRRPKDLLKRALSGHVPRELAYRSKLGFGQPIFEWMAPGGQLRPWVERIGAHDFLDRDTLAAALARPNWFLYSLLCYDLWHKLFIDRTISRTAREPDHRPARMLAGVW
jgi:asparagine synthase (glutamine-hydrolysing)